MTGLRSFAALVPFLAACSASLEPQREAVEAAACERVTAADARGFDGLELMGTSGDVRFYGRPRELLCSEPGAGGAGECELVGATEVRVETPGEVYGFRTSGAGPALLNYSPRGVGCRAR